MLQPGSAGVAHLRKAETDPVLLCSPYELSEGRSRTVQGRKVGLRGKLLTEWSLIVALAARDTGVSSRNPFSEVSVASIESSLKKVTVTADLAPSFGQHLILLCAHGCIP